MTPLRPIDSFASLKHCLESNYIFCLEVSSLRQTGKSVFLKSLASGYARLYNNRVLLVLHNKEFTLNNLERERLSNIGVDIRTISSIFDGSAHVEGIQYDAILIDEPCNQPFSALDLYNTLLRKRMKELKSLVMIRRD